MITAKIDVTKIDKAHLFEGKSGTYLDLALFENKDGNPGKFGDDGYIVQSVGKAARESGVKGPIIGNWKKVETGCGQRPPPTPTPTTTPAPETKKGVPF